MTFNDKILYLMFFIFAIGLSCGAFFEVYMEGAGKEQLMQFLSTLFDSGAAPGFWSGLLKSILNWIAFLILPFCVIYLPPLSVFCPFIPFIKGLSLGFSSTMLVETFGIKGGLYIATTLLPQSIIQIPVLCFLISLSIVSAHPKYKKALHQDARQYYIYYCTGGLLIVISCLLEALLMRLIL